MKFNDIEAADYVSKETRKFFRSKEKFRSDHFLIVLTDQFLKNQLCNFVTSKVKGVDVLKVSGTIKKCKSYIKILTQE
jgi:hypothetical protein